MPLLFRSNASRYEKIYTLTLVGLCGLVIFGISNHFVAEPVVESAAGYLAVPVAIALFIPFFRDRHPANKIPSLGIIRRALMYILMFGMMCGFVWVGLTLGGAAAFTQLFGQERVEELTVVRKSDGGWSARRCSYSVEVEGRTIPSPRKICVEKEFWQHIARGDKLMARQKYSLLGSMTYELSR